MESWGLAMQSGMENTNGAQMFKDLVQGGQIVPTPNIGGASSNAVSSIQDNASHEGYEYSNAPIRTTYTDATNVENQAQLPQTKRKKSNARSSGGRKRAAEYDGSSAPPIPTMRDGFESIVAPMVPSVLLVDDSSAAQKRFKINETRGDAALSGKKRAEKSKRNIAALDMAAIQTMAAGDVQESSDASDLHCKWLSPAALKELVQKGIEVKAGKFSALEDQIIRDQVQIWCDEQKKDLDQLLSGIILANRNSKADSNSAANEFWTQISFDTAKALPGRPLASVYHHVKRMYHPMGRQGEWTKKQHEDLITAYANNPNQWQEISKSVGRMDLDCRDRYRNHVLFPDRAMGTWSNEEESRLSAIMEEMNPGRTKDTDHLWTAVAEKMGGQRSRQQCRVKWNESLSKKHEGIDGSRWNADVSLELLNLLQNKGCKDEREVDWASMREGLLQNFTPSQIQRRWAAMRARVINQETKTFSNLVIECSEHLAEKHCEKSRKRDSSQKKRKNISDAVVDGA